MRKQGKNRNLKMPKVTNNCYLCCWLNWNLDEIRIFMVPDQQFLDLDKCTVFPTCPSEFALPVATI